MPVGEVDTRTTITIEIEQSQLLVIVEKPANGECQTRAEGPVYVEASSLFRFDEKGRLTWPEK